MRKAIKMMLMLFMLVGGVFSVINFISTYLDGSPPSSAASGLNERAYVLNEDGDRFVCDGDGNEC